MNLSLAQQYEYLNQRRRIAQLYKQMLLESKAAAIQHVYQFLVTGGDPKKDPNISAIYYALVDEFGESLFQAENSSHLDGYVLTKEEERYKYN